MSPEGIKELWTDLLESNPEIQGVIMELDSNHKLPSTYNEADVRELDDLNLD